MAVHSLFGQLQHLIIDFELNLQVNCNYCIYNNQLFTFPFGETKKCEKTIKLSLKLKQEAEVETKQTCPPNAQFD